MQAEKFTEKAMKSFGRQTGKDGKYYVAQFNIGEEEITAKTDLAFVGIMPNENVKITEVWENKKAELNDNTIISTVPPHGVKLFEIVL